MSFFTRIVFKKSFKHVKQFQNLIKSLDTEKTFLKIRKLFSIQHPRSNPEKGLNIGVKPKLSIFLGSRIS